MGLPPSGVVATAAPDPELTAMLARAAVSIGLEVNRPPSPEPSRLDDWFLRAGRGSQLRPAPVPFFPEVHEELTSSWMAPFTARSRSSASSVLTTLDGGVARGYAGIPQVERAVVVHLCPRNAATWTNRSRLPSKACKLIAALAAKAYSAAGQAASALHAMAILQVHQAKALKQVHEGSTDPGLMQELRTATDFALRATKVMPRSLGKAMSTMVVQERHLWLNLGATGGGLARHTKTSAELRAGRHQTPSQDSTISALSQFLPVCWVSNGREELAVVTLAAPFPLTRGYERLFLPQLSSPDGEPCWNPPSTPGSQTGRSSLTPGPVLVLARPGLRSAPVLG